MAAGDVVGTKKCRCGGQLKYTEGKSGSISGACDTCKRQTFDRTPAAVTALRASLAGTKKTTEPASSGGGGFDLSKL